MIRRAAAVLLLLLATPAFADAVEEVRNVETAFAKAFAEQLPLTLREPPFAIPGFAVKARWHVRLDRDPGVAWLRAMLRGIVP